VRGGVRLLILAVSLAGCAPRGTAAAPKASATQPVGEPAIVATDRNSGNVGIEPYAPTAPAISIEKPLADGSVPVEAARSQPVVVDDAGYLDENPSARITLVLDGDVVRDVQDARAPLTLGSLDLAGRALEPGEHVLVAVAVGPRGEAARFGPDRRIASAVRRFFVGASSTQASSTSGPMLVVLVPRGTYNGPSRTKAALLDFVVLGGDIGVDGLSLSVRVAGPRGASKTVLTAPGPYSLRGLESGDHHLEIELQKPDRSPSGPWSRASRTITVNLDGPAR
jgi:hypothetical protein